MNGYWLASLPHNMFFATIGIVAHGNTFPLAGTILSTQCVDYTYYENGVTAQNGPWGYQVTRADGIGGSTTSVESSNSNGCYLPYGFVFSSNNYDIQLPGPYQPVTVGYGYESSISNGYGGTINSSGQTYNVECDGTYTTQGGMDINGQPATTHWKRDCTPGGSGYYTTTYLNAGVLMSIGCTTAPYNFTDAAGTQWQNVNIKQRQYADGNGGYYYEDTPNEQPCGAWPSGYAFSYTSGPISLNYQDEFYQWQMWTYGTSSSGYYSDGTYDGAYASASTTIDYPAGYVFYSYFQNPDTNHNYTFDGMGGYYDYETYVEPPPP